jgi:hypothetical protein
MGVGGQQHTPAAFPAEKRLGTHCTERQVVSPSSVWMGAENLARTRI